MDNFKLNNSLISFSGYIDRKGYLINLIKILVCGVALVSILVGIAMSTDGNSKNDIIWVPISVGVAFMAYLTSLSNAIRRVRDIFGGPISDNVTAIFFVIATFIPYINLIALIYYIFKPGLISEPNLAKNPDFVIPVQGMVAQSTADELAKLNALKNQGILTDEEYAQAKSKVLKVV